MYFPSNEFPLFTSSLNFLSSSSFEIFKSTCISFTWLFSILYNLSSKLTVKIPLPLYDKITLLSLNSSLIVSRSLFSSNDWYPFSPICVSKIANCIFSLSLAFFVIVFVSCALLNIPLSPILKFIATPAKISRTIKMSSVYHFNFKKFIFLRHFCCTFIFCFLFLWYSHHNNSMKT